MIHTTIIYKRYNPFSATVDASIFAEQVEFDNEGAFNAYIGEIEANDIDVLERDAIGSTVVLKDGTVGKIVRALEDGGVVVSLHDENGQPVTKNGFIEEAL